MLVSRRCMPLPVASTLTDLVFLTYRLLSTCVAVWLIYKKMKAEERYNGAVQYTGNGEWVPKYGQPVPAAHGVPPPSYGATQ